jgi:lipopolysaccharide transport system ATP-binding protein
LQICILYDAPQPIPNPIFGVTITHEDGFVCYDTSTATTGVTIPTIHGQGQITLDFERLDLMPGPYFIEVGVYEQNWAYAYDYHWHVYPFLVKGTAGEKGILRPPHRWHLEAGRK